MELNFKGQRPSHYCSRRRRENCFLLCLCHYSEFDAWTTTICFIENVITDENYRNRGLATACLNYAKELAVKENCYKLMLLTGSKKDSTLRFYEKAGYNSKDKTAFIQWI